tara:strand:+ start:2029 stop:2739 length:711 start_codon:yes stop_codon:yes gene_type:complete
MSWFTDTIRSVTDGGVDLPDIDFLSQDTDPATRMAGLLGGSALLKATGLADSQSKKVGYQGKIPDYAVERQMVPQSYDPNRRAGSSGQRYFTDTQYVSPGGEEAAKLAATEQAEGLAALNLANPARQERKRPAVGIPMPVEEMAAGGIATLKKGKYLDGKTDGMADEVPATIEGTQEARLSDGEFVIPADVVSHLGNGNSDAGAKVLESMMARVRKARTGNDKQGKEIDPKKFIPA